VGLHFKPKDTKKAEDDSVVTVYTDATGAWYVGREGDMATDPKPMGAFISRHAAKQWADRHYPGGSWG
jgi:hypothetical protein